MGSIHLPIKLRRKWIQRLRESSLESKTKKRKKKRGRSNSTKEMQKEWPKAKNQYPRTGTVVEQREPYHRPVKIC